MDRRISLVHLDSENKGWIFYGAIDCKELLRAQRVIGRGVAFVQRVVVDWVLENC